MKHHKKLQNLFQDTFPESKLAPVHKTPKAHAHGFEIRPFDVQGEGTVIAGEPLHDLFKLRSITSVFACDREDLLADHKDALSRLSRPEMKQKQNEPKVAPPNRLGNEAARILHRAVELPRKKFKQILPNYRPASIEELQNFISHEKVLESEVWLKEFQAKPPRRTLERLATITDAKLHYCNGFHGYSHNSEFETEMQRIYSWYKPGRETLRHKRGIKRGPKDGPWKRGRRSAITKKVKKHYDTLRNYRMEDLLNWRLAAKALIRAATQRHQITQRRIKNYNVFT